MARLQLVTGSHEEKMRFQARLREMTFDRPSRRGDSELLAGGPFASVTAQFFNHTSTKRERGAHLTFFRHHNLGDLERGHSCRPLRRGQYQTGQECPRSEKSEMRTERDHNEIALGWQSEIIKMAGARFQDLAHARMVKRAGRMMMTLRVVR